jgi:adenylylsulfate kinase
MKILILGLPGSGKSTLARELAYHFLIPHHNADTYREMFDDWDFSPEGRLRQAKRMADQVGILDFVCPLEELRDIVDADFTIWMNTIKEGRFEDTNKLFEVPDSYDLEVTEWIDLDRLRSSLEGFNPGTKGILYYLREHFPKLVK